MCLIVRSWLASFCDLLAWKGPTNASSYTWHLLLCVCDADSEGRQAMGIRAFNQRKGMANFPPILSYTEKQVPHLRTLPPAPGKGNLFCKESAATNSMEISFTATAPPEIY